MLRVRGRNRPKADLELAKAERKVLWDYSLNGTLRLIENQPLNTVWPFDYIRKRKYERRYKAALIVFLGNYLFEQLTADEKSRVELEVDDNFNRTDTPAIAWRNKLMRDDLAANRSAAMDRLGLQPTIPGLAWAELFEPWRVWRRVPEWPRKASDDRPFLLIYDYHWLDTATLDARNFLRRHGFAIPDMEPVEKSRTYYG